MSDASSSPCKRGAEMPGMEGAEGHGSPFWGGKGGYNATDGHYE